MNLGATKTYVTTTDSCPGLIEPEVKVRTNWVELADTTVAVGTGENVALNETDI